MVEGEVSTAVTAWLDDPHERSCLPCDAVHPSEMPFRLAARRGRRRATIDFLD